MTIYKQIIIGALAVASVAAVPIYAQSSAKRSETIVVVDGDRYLVHHVDAGETLYSLCRLYDVGQEQIFKANPELRQEGLKAGGSIKIPYKGSSNQRADRRSFNSHTIANGETLYSISRRYQISVNTIMSDNKGLDPAKLSVGQRINIRRSELGKSDVQQIEAEMEQYGKALESVDKSGYRYYIADNGETINIIAKRIGVSSESLSKANNISAGSKLSKGTILRIETERKEAELIASENEVGDEPFFAREIDFDELLDPAQRLFSIKRSDEELKIALLLPMTMGGREVRQFAEFYKGFLLGVENLKNQEYNITVNLFDTQRSATRVEYIMTQSNFLECDLIVGPVYEELLQPVVNYAEVSNIPVVSPLATLSEVSSPVLFQLAPDTDHRYDKIESMLNEDTTVTLIYGESNDEEYERSIISLLGRHNMDFTMHSYRYEHPSAISDRNRAADELMKEIYRDADEFGIKLDSIDMQGLLPDLSTSDLTPLVANKAEHNLFFIMSDNETDVDRILSALSSSYKSQRSRNYRRSKDEVRLELRAPSSYNVIANPDWRNFKSIDKTSYFNNRVIMFSPYLASRDSRVVREFDSRYAAEFDDFSSLYAYRGYDAAVIFGEGFYYDIAFGMDGMDYTPLQNSYFFDQQDEDGSRVNINWMMVKYNPNFTTTIN